MAPTRVLVTGGLGGTGRWIVDRLADAGREVVCVDLEHPPVGATTREGVTFRAADLADAGEAFDLVASVDPDAVVHLAAIRTPEHHAGSRVFETNVLAAYNVLTAAGRAGARVVQASSEAVYGNTFAAEPRLPDALPIREDHPLRPEDPYGLSKVVAEAVGGAVARRFGVPVASLRLPWVQFPGEYRCLDADPRTAVSTYWSYVDARDTADAVAAALCAPFEGHEAVNVAAAKNYRGRPTADLFESAFGRVPETCALDGEESAHATARAADLLGWSPSREWRTAAEESVPEPWLVEN